MRKDRLSSYQAKKEKLKKIKNKLLEWKQEGIHIFLTKDNPNDLYNPIAMPIEPLKYIWEIVKDE